MAAKDLTVDRFINNSTYEIGEGGVRFKVFGIPYLLNENDLDRMISFLMRMRERLLFIKKEKEDIFKTPPLFQNQIEASHKNSKKP